MQRRHRLRQQSDFQRVRQGKRSWAHPLVVLSVAENGREETRVGILVSRRVGKAVERNRARRLLREALRRHVGRLAPGWDLVWIARPAIAGQRLGVVEAAVSELLARAGLLAPAGSDR
jgi:ribonuclease P protein component